MKINPSIKLIPITDNGSLCSCASSDWLCAWWTPSGIKERTPSGMITAKAVPTNSPAPNTVTLPNLSCGKEFKF